MHGFARLGFHSFLDCGDYRLVFIDDFLPDRLLLDGENRHQQKLPVEHPKWLNRRTKPGKLAIPGIGDNPAAPLFRPQKSVRGNGRDGFRLKAMTTRAVEKLIERYVTALNLDRNVTVHSLRVKALTTARERGSDIIDLQDFAGHADPRTTLTYIRSRDRLSKSPAYVLKY
jgi:integrase